MAKTATLLLTHVPDEDRMIEIVETLVQTYGPQYSHVSWFLTDTVPPAGYGTDIIDQLEAHKRDTPDSVYLTVLMDNESASFEDDDDDEGVQLD